MPSIPHITRYLALLSCIALATGCPDATADRDTGRPASDTATLPADTAPDASDTPSETTSSDAPGARDTRDTTNGTREDTSDAADTTADAWPPKDVRDFPPFVVGPPPATFDCRAAGERPDRTSPVPLGCVTDPSCDRPLVVGHRGAGGHFGVIAPENSLAAIRAAIVMGADGVELDVRHTRDDGLVLMHDETVDRTTTASGPIAEMTTDEATDLPLTPPDPDTIGDFSCSTVPTLREALELTADRVFVDLDMKTDHVADVVDLIVDLDLTDQVFVSSSSPSTAETARDHDPSVRVQVRPDTREELDAVMMRLATPPDVVEIPVDRVDAFAPTIHEASAKVFAAVFDRDAEAVDDRSDDPYTPIYDAGADILQTEFPTLVLEKLGR